MNEKELKLRKEKAVGLRAYRLEENFYAVESSDGDRFYKVLKDEERMLCACPDFTRHGGENGWKCKHILAVEQSLENCLESSATSHSSRQCQGFDRKLLEAPFEPSQVRQRKGAFGDVLDYVEGHTVIRKLNDAFDGKWSFEVIDHKILDEEAVVLARLKVDGISKMQFGSSKITRSKEDNAQVSIGDDLKAATTDALKKAATHFGVGLHLYEEKNAVEFPFGDNSASEEKDEPEDNHKPQRLTNKQLAFIYSIAKEKGISQKDLEQRILDVFKKRPEYLTKQEASEVIKKLQEIEVNVPTGTEG
ncbi:MAG TPA: Rad52/Rad22 family DNA repair protein [Candidatus Brocadiia bacterium]|nr:Rad52/Rad22 family DNA repair protein [Candidatus Brocadiales bacterium]